MLGWEDPASSSTSLKPASQPRLGCLLMLFFGGSHWCCLFFRISSACLFMVLLLLIKCTAESLTCAADPLSALPVSCFDDSGSELRLIPDAGRNRWTFTGWPGRSGLSESSEATAAAVAGPLAVAPVAVAADRNAALSSAVASNPLCRTAFSCFNTLTSFCTCLTDSAALKISMSRSLRRLDTQFDSSSGMEPWSSLSKPVGDSNAHAGSC
mmetsp:Transcript_52127/g.91603  ORF Transcript_52127/g.91603 Transcript_52127/m.91603 type:complete len:211 (-) Transcript_52127:79-711(-)